MKNAAQPVAWETNRETGRKNKKFLEALKGVAVSNPPFWFMRQAGRYLPEYLKTRVQAGSFLDLCFNPELATEVTLQPLRRYGMDAAILFSDILVVPLALGQEVRFEAGEGPRLGNLELAALNLKNFHARLEPVYETVDRLRGSLDNQTALIGFAGAPWTVATYMIEGGSSREFVNTKRMAYAEPEKLSALIDLLVEGTADYLCRQVDAGAEALQIFDSWAGVLPPDLFETLAIIPTQQIVDRIHQQHPDIPIIGFPKGAGVLYADYARSTGVTAVSLDPAVPPHWAVQNLQAQGFAVQGNLDPMALLAGGDAMITAASNICDVLKEGPFVFNLGHGIHKETPPENLSKLCEFLRG